MQHPAPGPDQKPTYADIERLPPNVVGEILGGELVVSPRPAGPHTVSASVLGGALMGPFHLGLGGPGGWWILDEPELSLAVDPGFDPVVPDLAGWRLTSMPDKPVTAQFHVVPDWVCEVQSPSTARHDRMLKLPFYARAGVRHAWLVDPLAETVEVFELRDGQWVLHAVNGQDQVVSLPPFEALLIPLSVLWGRQPPQADPEQDGESDQRG